MSHYVRIVAKRSLYFTGEVFRFPPLRTRARLTTPQTLTYAHEANIHTNLPTYTPRDDAAKKLPPDRPQTSHTITSLTAFGCACVPGVTHTTPPHMHLLHSWDVNLAHWCLCDGCGVIRSKLGPRGAENVYSRSGPKHTFWGGLKAHTYGNLHAHTLTHTTPNRTHTIHIHASTICLPAGPPFCPQPISAWSFMVRMMCVQCGTAFTPDMCLDIDMCALEIVCGG